MIAERPMPPPCLTDDTDWDSFLVDAFRPAPDLAAWIHATFIAPGGALYNEAHAHLEQASIGWLWTSCLNHKAGRRIVGTCERGDPQAMGKWAKARARQQVMDWFGTVPDFIITLDAMHWASIDNATACAIAEHELSHAAQETDEYGAPKFRKDGSPAFTIRGHDVEEFIGVVERYGAQATGITRLIEAAQRGPSIGLAQITGACGTCAKV